MGRDTVDVWRVNLLAECTHLSAHKACLSDDEWVRFEQFKNHKQADYYAIVRSVQRQILAKYLGGDPRLIRIQKGLYGKPEVGNQKLFFNISHSADCLLVAVSSRNEVGVDIELVKERNHLPVLVDRCFALKERQYWLDLPDIDKLEFFYRFWVAKEAFVKAVGRGIALGMSGCELSLPDQSGFGVIPQAYGSADDWSLTFLDIDSAHQAALVTQAKHIQVNVLSYKIDRQ